jgi:hypothetical protein
MIKHFFNDTATTEIYTLVEGAHYFDGAEIVCGATEGNAALVSQPGFVGRGCDACHAAAEARLVRIPHSDDRPFLTDAQEREIERRQMGLGDL